MTKIKFYTDKYIPNAVVKGLLKRRIDILSCVEAGTRTAIDEEHLTYANQTQRVLLTLGNIPMGISIHLGRSRDSCTLWNGIEDLYSR